ncbi:hypothetical protein M0M57_08675 [Flavobacterium azooxidireducens]|uniref:Transposase IS200-like domain-containing protein n=1 Tax=Flavobacterium azooxidireducens TaxID=1871076 RepID=A0ABY4KDY6_9FLAO|nr:transposase [Flavobacterium azooxidireducens]UPQ77707.1 hypothetical protein M0M57_08675 [Flavobacterium azooxidireducens]
MSNIICDTLESGHFYHIYNRGVNSCSVFIDEENYFFFLSRFKKYLSDFIEVYAYCLMPNHFHFLIRVKNLNSDSFVKVQNFDKALQENGLHSNDSLVSKQFAKLFSSYTQAFNKVQNRHGALFESPFKRKRIENDEYLRNLILYIHRNPIDLNQNFETYKFSSYKAIISDLRTDIKKQLVIERFDNMDNFIYLHKNPPKLNFNF